MYGRYSEALGDYAREEAERQRVSEKGLRRRSLTQSTDIFAGFPVVMVSDRSASPKIVTGTQILTVIHGATSN